MTTGLKLPDNEPKTPFEKWLKAAYPILPPNFTLSDMRACWEEARMMCKGEFCHE